MGSRRHHAQARYIQRFTAVTYNRAARRDELPILRSVIHRERQYSIVVREIDNRNEISARKIIEDRQIAIRMPLTMASSTGPKCAR